MSASLASLKRAERKLGSLLMRQAKRDAATRAANALADAVAQDARIAALRGHLNASPAALAWVAWATERTDARIRADLDALALAESMPGAETAELPSASDLERRAHRSHARYLLSVAYGVEEARKAALAAWEEEHAPLTETADDDAPHRAARRAAVKRAVAACTAHLRSTEPECPTLLRGAAAMLALLTSPTYLQALPSTVRAGLMLPDACRTANLLLPQSAQVSPETVETLAGK